MKRPPGKVLIVHNHYRADRPSGENRVITEMASALQNHGIDVRRFDRFSDDIANYSLLQKALLPIAPIHSFEATRKFRALIASWKPDIVHVHNVYPLISPSILRFARKAQVPVIHFVHNYRHICLNGLMIRNDTHCALCIEKRSNLPAIRYGCYRGSRSQTAVLALSERVHRQDWGQVDRYMAVSRFVKRQLVAGGFPEERISIIPNTTQDPGTPTPPARPRFLFAGRLDFPKGLPLLLEAWSLTRATNRFSLGIAGNGPLADAAVAAQRNLRGVEYLGQLDQGRLAQAYQSSAAVVVPSVVHETFGLTALEAFAHGRPVIATTMGGLPELVDDTCGWLADPSPASFAAVLDEVAGGWYEIKARGAAARRRYEGNYSPAAVVERLLAVHDDLLSKSHRQ